MDDIKVKGHYIIIINEEHIGNALEFTWERIPSFDNTNTNINISNYNILPSKSFTETLKISLCEINNDIFESMLNKIKENTTHSINIVMLSTIDHLKYITKGIMTNLCLKREVHNIRFVDIDFILTDYLITEGIGIDGVKVKKEVAKIIEEKKIKEEKNTENIMLKQITKKIKETVMENLKELHFEVDDINTEEDIKEPKKKKELKRNIII
jgi:hypothetical protein